jgi:hypothetical protein
MSQEHEHWPNLKKAIDGAISAVDRNDRAGFRIHINSAERIAGDIGKHSKGDAREHAQKIEKDVRNAKNSIDIARAGPILKALAPMVDGHAGGAAAAPPK